MNIGNVGYSQHAYAKPMQPNQTAKANEAQAAEATKQSYAQAAKEVADGKAVNQATEAEGKPSSSVESFTYGALGMDHPEEVKNNDDMAYSAGQVLSALGTIGGLIAVLV
ncbi:hypothetical protein AL542_09065 [Grimontia hollisae]|uniref:Uncharacterized protein n=2 Tax=Grimontia hollisae TaxID=673 RepID=D0I474_GRIHO|nr:hypothetical protein [Grimontia hollisae]AMG30517.1 hypothetical protein AL542_09065 [Grimontia hollisae]EEY73852.1 hypothetical protein VHA_000539 [Grimontia hollisae CIP 101886]MDF2183755.1 hypothetical protein [Grimontia hollisae]STO41883.1 Uncharacterised protein [Grimontia hollisae]STO55807.1 Uncharacterised protein [Grimontia hollisae]